MGAKFFYSGLLDAKVPIWVSLPFILIVVATSILASLYKTRGQGHGTPPGSKDQ